ncbi:amidohydrolase family protein [Sporolactobacillus sp. THM19-2]|uniref:dihydroorotase n=1 Tax=Sporolactobacillus sp. THM19-2 TaxID=2511171 RepID=UPI00197D8D2B|nr:amidohydrolase family protein [Sporolactobacillus sp. THM19-2]
MQRVRITAETCPHYLVFNEDDFLSKGMFFKCAPPLRSKEASNMLWRYILDGTLDLVVSDHSPCADTEKSETEGAFHALGGISGIQTGLQVMFHEIVSKRKWSPTLISRLMARNPAHIFGMKGKKGELTLGYDVDFVLVDPNASWEISADNLKYLNQSSAFIGYKGTGRPVCTILRGNVVAEDGIVKGKYGFGRFIRRWDQ